MLSFHIRRQWAIFLDFQIFWTFKCFMYTFSLVELTTWQTSKTFWNWWLASATDPCQGPRGHWGTEIHGHKSGLKAVKCHQGQETSPISETNFPMTIVLKSKNSFIPDSKRSWRLDKDLPHTKRKFTVVQRRHWQVQSYGAFRLLAEAEPHVKGDPEFLADAEQIIVKLKREHHFNSNVHSNVYLKKIKLLARRTTLKA